MSNIERDCRQFEGRTSQQAENYLGQTVPEVRKFLRKTIGYAEKIFREYAQHPQIEEYRARIKDHVRGLTTKLDANVKK